MLIVSGDVARPTGGNLYDRRVERACRRAGVPLRIVSARSTAQARTQLARLKPRVLLIDSIAIPIVAPLLPWVRNELGARVVALMHMRTTSRGTSSVLRSADRIVAVSPDLARTLAAQGARRARIVVIRPGSDQVRRLRRGKPRSRQVRVLTVANWSPSKGIATLVAAAARVPEVRLDLVGDTGKAAYGDRVRARIASSGLRDRAVVHGPLVGSRLARRYAAADIFALPTEREGYGIVFAEALAHGLPVIASNIAAARAIVGDAGIFVTPRRVRPLVSALRLMTDPWLRRRLGAAAHERARSLPTWAASEAAFVALVRREMRLSAARA